MWGKEDTGQFLEVIKTCRDLLVAMLKMHWLKVIVVGEQRRYEKCEPDYFLCKLKKHRSTSLLRGIK